jgi:hypothetical protein
MPEAIVMKKIVVKNKEIANALNHSGGDLVKLAENAMFSLYFIHEGDEKICAKCTQEILCSDVPFSEPVEIKYLEDYDSIICERCSQKIQYEQGV